MECVTTRAVLEELRRGAVEQLEWLAVVPTDQLDVLYRFAEYMNRLGNVERNAGEASVLAWAEAHPAAAYVDDQVACNVARSRGVIAHRTLQLVIEALRAEHLTPQRPQNLIDRLVDTDARFPTEAHTDLLGWGRARGLLP